ncbi:hypothetical protein [Glycomyces terrestris]|uniref:Uncharacterized protein n=1 Tax=Glycomyces terrestris TaxID=2493553 RepID=A0A426US95_9ACTN|nr:hypothetical protein [Glycomyces terrestris]RRR96074.1 hypothetical protein EIW28_22690 [Glycomyces terrestris]
MPTYEEALAANPATFVDCAAAMSAAGTDLTEHRAEYDAKVVEINAGWEDRANTAFNADAVVVDDHVEDVVSQVGGAAELLDAGGAAMQSMVEQLRALDQAYRGAGFEVRPAPKVELGAVHWAAIAAAGPFGPMLQALFQARADEGTVQLQLGLAVLTATDAATGAGLVGAAEELKPLEDKASAMERTERRTDVADDDQSGDDTADTGDRDRDGTTRQRDDDGKDKDQEKEKDEKDEDEKDGDGKDEDTEQELGEDEGSEAPQEDPEQPGTDAPGPDERPEIPGYEPPPAFGPGEYTPPEFSGSDWDPAELGDGAEAPSGGLAGGGGGGFGAGAGLGTEPAASGPGSGLPVGGMVAGPGGAAGGPAAGGPGARGGGLGGMVGAPGARGAGVNDDEYERESFLTEDPEEDVWGIGTAENNPYVDFQEEQEAEADEEAPPAPAPDELPPFALPGFDLPEPKQN